jgi:hypothetical protein
MARGELMKKLLGSYGRDEEFRAVAEQIILEEEKKNNKILARSLRRLLESSAEKAASTPKGLAPLLPFPDAAADFVERIEPSHTHKDIVLSQENTRVFVSLVKEYRHTQKGTINPLQASILRAARLRQNPLCRDLCIGVRIASVCGKD